MSGLQVWLAKKNEERGNEIKDPKMFGKVTIEAKEVEREWKVQQRMRTKTVFGKKESGECVDVCRRESECVCMYVRVCVCERERERWDVQRERHTHTN